MTDTAFRAAIRDALDEEMTADPDVIVFGEDVAAAGGVWATTPGLLDKHGPDRIFDTPISELALTGAAFGSAACGKRPVIEIMFGDFLTISMDSLVNQASKWWYLSGGKLPIPLVVRSAVGGGAQFGAIHSQVPISWFLGVPGLKIVCPSTPNDAKALLRAAVRDNNPVLFLEHKRLYATKGLVDVEPAKIGEAKIVRPGRDLTIATAMKSVHDALAAADELAKVDIEVEVIDLRTLRPLDTDTVLESVRRTNRLLVVEEGPRTGGWAGEVLAEVSERGLEDLDDVWRLACPDTPVPYSPDLELAMLPSSASIVDSIRNRIRVVETTAIDATVSPHSAVARPIHLDAGSSAR